jgi:protein-S-isoprenylcysteine O-methyltransferase Ste14
MMSIIVLFLTTAAYAAVHSILATLGMKNWARERFGLVADRWYRLAYNLFAVISGLPILVLLNILPDQSLYQIPSPWIFITALGQLAGILIIVFGILPTDLWHFVGLRQIIEPEGSEPAAMITTGLYGWVRHPLYTGGLLVIWLTPTMTLNLLTIFVILTIYLVVGAKLEEQRLVHEFEDHYRAYQKQVPMLIPKLRRTK